MYAIHQILVRKKENLDKPSTFLKDTMTPGETASLSSSTGAKRIAHERHGNQRSRAWLRLYGRGRDGPRVEVIVGNSTG
jgi:hypothetical protein